MAYKLTTLYGLAHGHAVALCVDALWPYMIGHTEDAMDVRGKAYLDDMFLRLAQVMGCASSMDAAVNAGTAAPFQTGSEVGRRAGAACGFRKSGAPWQQSGVS